MGNVIPFMRPSDPFDIWPEEITWSKLMFMGMSEKYVSVSLYCVQISPVSDGSAYLFIPYGIVEAEEGLAFYAGDVGSGRFFLERVVEYVHGRDGGESIKEAYAIELSQYQSFGHPEWVEVFAGNAV